MPLFLERISNETFVLKLNMPLPCKPTISIVTATFNAEKVIPGLIESLRLQNDRNFDWIVVDGASTDSTVAILKSTSDVLTQWTSEPDFGIYNAMNKAVSLASTAYYLVLGADDRLLPDAIAQYRQYALKTYADIISAKIIRNGKIESIKPCWPWLYAHHAYVSEHSVGTLISRDLHKKFGLYSKRYPIGADVLFLKKACGSPETVRVRADFVAGEFGCNGTSRTDRVGAICDYFRAQMETEPNKYFQLFLFIIKLLKNAVSMAKSLKKFTG